MHRVGQLLVVDATGASGEGHEKRNREDREQHVRRDQGTKGRH